MNERNRKRGGSSVVSPVNGQPANPGAGSAFAVRLRSLREKLGLSQEALAQKIGVSRNTIQNYEAGQLPKGAHLISLCELLGVSADDLLLGRSLDSDVSALAERPGEYKPEPSPTGGWKAVKVYRRPDAARIEPEVFLPDHPEFDHDMYRLIPLVETHLDAGGGAVVLSEKTDRWLAFRRDWLNAHATTSGNVVLMTVHGDSMEPTLKSGDVVMVDFGRRRVYDGLIYALGEDDLVMVKRVFILPGDKLRITSDNPEPRYAPYEALRAQIRVLGQVIWFARELV